MYFRAVLTPVSPRVRIVLVDVTEVRLWTNNGAHGPRGKSRLAAPLWIYRLLDRNGVIFHRRLWIWPLVLAWLPVYAQKLMKAHLFMFRSSGDDDELCEAAYTRLPLWFPAAMAIDPPRS